MQNKVIELPELPLYMGDRNNLILAFTETGSQSAGDTHAIT